MKEINIHVYNQGVKTDALICNWCGEPHAVEPEYKKNILERGKVRLEEALKENPELADQIQAVKPEDTWTCGKCYFYVHGIPECIAKNLQTECHDHEVPKERRN